LNLFFAFCRLVAETGVNKATVTDMINSNRVDILMDLMGKAVWADLMMNVYLLLSLLQLLDLL
jgi:hypothetical protein